MADFQAHIPQEGDETLQAVAQGLIRTVGHQHQHVHIRTGVKLGPAIAAHGHQCHAIPVGESEQGPGGNHYLVHQIGPGADQFGNVGGGKGLVEALLTLLQILAGILARLGAFLEGLKQLFLGQGRGEGHECPVVVLRACQSPLR